MLKLFKQNKMFRILLTYQIFSGLGGGMFSLFMLLSMHLIHRNSMFTGITGFLMAAPHIFSFAVGPIVDRRNKITIMRLTTFLEFVVLALLAFTPLQEYLGVMFMFAVVFTYSIANLFEAPAGTAFLPQIVKEEEIMEANSLISIASLTGGVAIGAILFTSLAGEINFRFLYGFSALFLALAFLFSLFLKNAAAKESTDKVASNYLQDLKEGAKFLKRSVLLYITIAVVAMSFAGEITYVNRPLFLEYHVGGQGYVLFTLASLVGGVAASYFVGIMGKKFKLGKLIFVLLVFTSAVRITFALVVPTQYIGGLVAMAVYSAIATAVSIIFGSMNQKIPSNDMVGRIDTMTSTFTAIAATFGALAGGFIGSIVQDAGRIFIFQGASYVVIGVLLMFVPSIRKLPKMNDIKKAESEE